jgi:hypothetical protein
MRANLVEDASKLCKDGWWSEHVSSSCTGLVRTTHMLGDICLFHTVSPQEKAYVDFAMTIDSTIEMGLLQAVFEVR